MQIIRQGGTISFEEIKAKFEEHGISVGTGNHLKTLLTPLEHTGLVTKSRSGGKTWYYITDTGKHILTRALGE